MRKRINKKAIIEENIDEVEEEVIDIPTEIEEDFKVDNQELSIEGEDIQVIIPKEQDYEVKPVEPKKLKVKMRVDHKCYVGGEWYYLKKDKQYSVPVNVKRILAEGDYLLPL